MIQFFKMNFIFCTTYLTIISKANEKNYYCFEDILPIYEEKFGVERKRNLISILKNFQNFEILILKTMDFKF